MESLLNMEPRIHETMSVDLARGFTNDEVVKTLRQVHHSKALGPDAMTCLFFQHHWHIIGLYITKDILLDLNSGQIPLALNHTFITLIIKKIQPLTIVNYHPISLCNVFYKIIFNVITNRLVIFGK